ncbi:Cadherin EGF LAG seven-pass G-type receptor 2 [Gossypium arboreum]|uniref:Cadherin EGF LAG seven-pass G-type receptor 2 n=1 Tax=Gossypium arboreum TaxID=29729 RepID=A0A0B0N7K8_GOSAR|nr:Cadherin EGF LAG seven-pass G-type receptor 2 [Gossypium arboreum]
MCASKTMASICDSNICVRVRPCLGQWHRYVTSCKTTFGMLALYDMCNYLSVLPNSKWFIGQRLIVNKYEI